MYECDICGKEFSNAYGAFIGPARPPYYDRMVYCKGCNDFVKSKTHKLNRKEVNYNVARRYSNR